jgi:hypothetical protein
MGSVRSQCTRSCGFRGFHPAKLCKHRRGRHELTDLAILYQKREHHKATTSTRAFCVSCREYQAQRSNALKLPSRIINRKRAAQEAVVAKADISLAVIQDRAKRRNILVGRDGRFAKSDCCHDLEGPIVLQLPLRPRFRVLGSGSTNTSRAARPFDLTSPCSEA